MRRDVNYHVYHGRLALVRNHTSLQQFYTVYTINIIIIIIGRKHISHPANYVSLNLKKTIKELGVTKSTQGYFAAGYTGANFDSLTTNFYLNNMKNTSNTQKRDNM